LTGSGVALGEKMEDTVYVGGVANVSEIEFKIEIVFNAVGFQRHCLAIGQVIDYRLHRGKIKRGVEQFHVVNLFVSFLTAEFHYIHIAFFQESATNNIHQLALSKKITWHWRAPGYPAANIFIAPAQRIV